MKFTFEVFLRFSHVHVCLTIFYVGLHFGNNENSGVFISILRFDSCESSEYKEVLTRNLRTGKEYSDNRHLIPVNISLHVVSLMLVKYTCCDGNKFCFTVFDCVYSLIYNLLYILNYEVKHLQISPEVKNEENWFWVGSRKTFFLDLK